MSTGWPAVRDKCAELGISFQTWQHGAGQIILAKRDDGKYAATIGGTVISIPRQVGKTFLVGAIVFAMCLLNPGLTVIWTAHRLRTAGETFESMQGMARRKKIRPLISKIVLGSGEEEVRFRNGSRILFGARERGFGRGFSEVDVLIFDEAQILSENAIDDMVPATNQSRQPSGALLLFTGTPPKPTDPGEVFRRKRDEALSGEDEDTAYIEFSADKNANPDDWKQVAKANPSYPQFTPREAIQRMRKNLTHESFMREGFGIWDELAGTSIFGAGFWESCLADRPDGLKVGGLAIAATLDMSRAALVAAGADGDRIHVRPLRHGPGVGWVVDAAKEAQQRHGGAPVVVDGRGPAAVLIPHLERAGVKLTVATTKDVLDSCASFYNRVQDARLGHADYPELNDAVRGAVKRTVGDRWALGRKDSAVDISPLEGAVLASWVAEQPAKRSKYDDGDLLVV